MKRIVPRADIELAPLELRHADRMLEWMHDPVVSRNYGVRAEPSLERTINWINNTFSDPTIKPFAVLLAGEHVGNVVLDRIDQYLSLARLSVYIGPSSVRAAGIGFTAMYLAMVEAFDKLQLHKVWVIVHARNYPSINMCTRLGFQLEGILRDEFLLDDERLPALYMGMLRADFQRISSDEGGTRE